ncbi:right-handed parallel beta-helix repeat-containing protein, partial [Methanobrevibacter sp.]|uniref:right-handed parallel beta-helix repeat-containing protein n=1 Tax=Methanobrevibacter sp. TaxID=66852 RepID=UPI002E76C824
AADTNNASISEDNSQMLLSLKNEITDDTSENSILAQTNNDETLSAQKDSEILRANEGTYSDLRNDINNGGNLTKSYYHYQQGDGDTIVINRNGFTVNGNGAVIDMKGSNIQAFEVTGSGVTFKNLTIKNANFDGSGGAIYFSKSGTVENCNFTGNTATYGGAVYFWNQGNVTNCNFTDNEATGTYSYGGAVYFEDGGTVLNCNFTGNTATTYGGAIRMYSGSVSNCNFTGNNATRGGAVYFLNTGNVLNCNFTGNNATTGSAIYFYSTSEQKSVSNSIFLNNRANAKDLQVTKNENNITIIFTGNNNILNAIYSRNDAEVSFSNVTYWGANGIVNTNSYTPSRTNKESGQNITVEIYGSDDNLVENVTLVTDDKGQVTYDFIKLRNGEYKYKAYHIKDCYYTYAEYKDTFTLNSDLGDFNRLQKYINGASENSILTLCRDYTFTIGSDENLVNGIVIDKPLTINGNGYTINALQKARIFNVNAGNVVLNDITFTNATASGSGGAIYFSQSGTVENCNFTDNQASGYGGAIRMSSGTVSNCNFTGNTATYSGGAIYFEYEGTVRNCNFTDNQASGGDGGAIRMSSGTVSNCNFTGNTATHGGGAVYFLNQGNVKNCNFTDNQASGGDGGAIRMSSGTVSNCNFTGNTATYGG